MLHVGLLRLRVVVDLPRRKQRCRESSPTGVAVEVALVSSCMSVCLDMKRRDLDERVGGEQC